MSKGKRPRHGVTRKEVLNWILWKLFWFLFVPVFAVLSYYTQIRPYFLTIHGEYITGVVDGAFSMACLIIIVIWMISKLIPEET